MRSCIIAVLALAAFCAELSAQDAHAASAMRMLASPLDVPETREGSGTSWLPTATPMYARHWQKGGWELMLHGNVFAQYIADSGDRGTQQFGSVNWVMGMAHRELAGGKLGLHAMFSADPLTVGKCGYPDILATGEECNGAPLHDQQHPHDVFMELTAGYEHALSRNLAFELYGGPVGEPALGPVAYPHRVSAMPGPSAPIGHHWMDATHISFGVATAGLYGRKWKAEASLFNGREPDDRRFNFDFAPLDSYSGRLWYMPGDNWAVQVSAGHLVEAEPGRTVNEPARDINRQTASLTYHRPFAAGGIWATTAVWGRNTHQGRATNAFLLETNLNLAERNVFLARWESAQKTGEDLVLSSRPDYANRAFNVHKLSFGYLRKLGHLAGFVPAVGIQENVSFLPSELKPFYATRTPAGIALFINLRAAPMAESAMPGMVMSPGAGAAPMASMPGMSGAGTPATARDSMPGMQAGGAQPAPVRDTMTIPGMSGQMGDTAAVMELTRRMMADPVIRARVMSDTALFRIMQRAMPGDSTSMKVNVGTTTKAVIAKKPSPAKKKSGSQRVTPKKKKKKTAPAKPLPETGR